MSNDVLVKVDGVSKKFCRRLKLSLWYGVQDTIGDLLGRDGSGHELRREEFWAVNDVSFELRRGECLGLIGRNGAGKTTLLKMLNGLIKPDRGRIEMRGRVCALIALGTGFNPVLTGRENIYVNAAVLGLSRNDIGRKIDDIIDFAEIGDFIDAPVQSYSSGMHVRLGFAVATALEPDVLLLDEVLAVGDANFQAKCYQRISGMLTKAGVIFVSHYPYHIQKVCNETMLLENGRTIAFGPPNDVLAHYADNGDEVTMTSLAILGAGVLRAEICSLVENAEYGGNLELALRVEVSHPVQCHQAYLNIVDRAGQAHAQVILDDLIRTFDTGISDLRIVVGPLFLSRGRYHGSLALWTRGGKETLAELRNCYSFRSDGPTRLGIACYYPISRVEVMKEP